MTHYTTQEGQHFCFPACLESFLAENGKIVSQQETLKRTPDIFGAHANDLGGFAPNNFPRIEKEYGLTTQQIKIDVPHPQLTQTESVFVICKWQLDDNQVHWVRLLDWDKEHVSLMNPADNGQPQKIDTTKFLSWILGAYLVKI